MATNAGGDSGIRARNPASTASRILPDGYLCDGGNIRENAGNGKG